jgi:enoyl reductase-like protein
VAALNFDTLEYVKQLTDAGVERQVAEIHAITVGRAMGMYVNNLVTQEYLDATLDARFAEQDLRIEKRFAEQDAKFEKRFAEQDLRIEKRFAEQDAKFEHRFNKAESDMRVLKWGQALVVATVLLPQLAKLVV